MTRSELKTCQVAIRRLALTDFRNYSHAALETDARHVVLVGDNGSGKTNMLEAVSFLSPGRGLRRARLDEVGNVRGPGAWAIAARLDGSLGPVEIGTGLQVDPFAGLERSRKIRVDRNPVRTSEALLDHLRVIWLTPAMDGLFTGGAGDRRRFFDRLVLALDPGHGSRVAAFEKAMRSRNRLLEDYQADASWLDGLEAQMAELGVAIILARQEAIDCLTALIAENHDVDGPFPWADITLEHGLETGESWAALDLEDRYRAILRDGRLRDRGAGRTLAGPHKADLLVRHGPKDMDAARSSTGEQKALLLGLILAHARLITRMAGHAPVMLLDEIAAHLDVHRRAALFDTLDELGGQAWMTGTDRVLFAALEGRAHIIRVDQGDLAEQDPL